MKRLQLDLEEMASFILRQRHMYASTSVRSGGKHAGVLRMFYNSVGSYWVELDQQVLYAGSSIEDAVKTFNENA